MFGFDKGSLEHLNTCMHVNYGIPSNSSTICLQMSWSTCVRYSKPTGTPCTAPGWGIIWSKTEICKPVVYDFY